MSQQKPEKDPKSKDFALDFTMYIVVCILAIVPIFITESCMGNQTTEVSWQGYVVP